MEGRGWPGASTAPTETSGLGRPLELPGFGAASGGRGLSQSDSQGVLPAEGHLPTARISPSPEGDLDST